MKDMTSIQVQRSTLAAIRAEIAHVCDRIEKNLQWVEGYQSKPKNPNAQGLSPDQLICLLLAEVQDKRRRGRESSERRTAQRRGRKPPVDA